MNIKQINEMYEEIKSASIGEMMVDKKSFSKRIVDLVAELDKHSKVSEEVVLQSMSEQEFVRLMLMVQKMVVAAILMNGDFSILQSDTDGSLQGYTHTVVLAVIGLLISEEIL